MKSIFDASQGLAGSITIAAAEQNSSFPFVTVPFFEAKAQQAREQSGIESFSYCPIITEENRFQWSSYAMDNKGWIENSRAASGGESESEAEIHPFLWTISDGYKVVESAGNGPFASLWQTSPLPLNPLASINYEMLSDPEFSRTLLVLSLTGGTYFNVVLRLLAPQPSHIAAYSIVFRGSIRVVPQSLRVQGRSCYWIRLRTGARERRKACNTAPQRSLPASVCTACRFD